MENQFTEALCALDDIKETNDIIVSTLNSEWKDNIDIRRRYQEKIAECKTTLHELKERETRSCDVLFKLNSSLTTLSSVLSQVLENNTFHVGQPYSKDCDELFKNGGDKISCCNESDNGTNGRSLEDNAVKFQQEDNDFNVLQENNAVIGQEEDNAVTVQQKDNVVTVQEEDHAIAVQEEDHAIAVQEEDHAIAAQDKDNVVTIQEEDHAIAAQNKNNVVTVQEEDHAIAAQNKNNVVTVQEDDHAIAAQNKNNVVTVQEEDHAIAVQREDNVVTVQEEDHATAVEKEDNTVMVQGKDNNATVHQEDNSVTALIENYVNVHQKAGNITPQNEQNGDDLSGPIDPIVVNDILLSKGSVAVRELRKKRTDTNHDNRLTSVEDIGERGQGDEESFIPNITRVQTDGLRQDPKNNNISENIREAVQVRDDYWIELASEEANKARGMRRPGEEGLATIFLIDTSASMTGEGIRQAREAFLAILDEIEKSQLRQREIVGVVFFGQHTRIVQHLTSNYTDIKNCLDDVVCEGASPMYAGLLMSIAVLKGNRGSLSLASGSWVVPPRIIIISDGQVTDSSFLDGPEDPVYYDQDHIRRCLYKFTEKMESMIFCVPVGQSDTEILGTLGPLTNGKLVLSPDVRVQIGRYHINVILAGKVFESLTEGNGSAPTDEEIRRILNFSEFGFSRTDADINAIKDMINNRTNFLPEQQRINEDPVYQDPNLPPFGSRVKRGPDWRYGNQDGGSLGTVVQHCERGVVGVLWDAGGGHPYRYVPNEAMDVELVDRPSVLPKGEWMTHGVLVERGPDWIWGDQDGGIGSKGVVYRYCPNLVICVRWLSNGYRGNYKYGAMGKYEVQICSESLPNGFIFKGIGHRLGGGNQTITSESTETINKGTGHRLGGGNEKPPSKSINTKNKGTGHRLGGGNQTTTTKPTETKYSESRNINKGIINPKATTSVVDTGYSESREINKKIVAARAWEWKDSNGEWRRHSKEANDIIEKAYKRKPESTALVDIGGVRFRVVMSKNIQINTMTEEKLDIRTVNT